MSDTDPSGNLNAQGVINISEVVRVKFLAQVWNEMNNNILVFKKTFDFL
jgi:hypothetical protein